MEYLNDIKFLQAICAQKTEIIYTKINLLDLTEFPIASLEGRIINGNISLDGTSAFARSCSLSMNVFDDSNFNSNQWTLESKVQIFIGVKNQLSNNKEYTIYQDYDIIYFPMGIYYLNSFNLTENNNGISISLSGKDKMCKLSGDLGGLFETITDLGAIDIIDIENNSTTKESISIKQIITELVHFYGHEPYEKILVNDIDDYGLNLMVYRGSDTLYYFISFKEYNNEIIPYIANCRFANTNIKRKINDNEYINDIEDDDHKLIISNPEEQPTDIISFNTLKTLIDNENLSGIQNIRLYEYKYLDNSIIPVDIENNINNFYDYMNLLVDNDNKNKFMIGKYEYGDTIGYELTQLIYPGDLIANPGESITSILDKIKKILGDYIYFYDLNGNFIFKKRNEYLNENSPLTISFSSKNTNFLLSNELIQSLQHTYNVTNIKNDFTIWGQQKLSNGITSDIHARYVIDEKPEQYISLNITKERAELLIAKYPNLYYSNKNKSKAEIINSLIQDPICYYYKNSNSNLDVKFIQTDWREIIYQMALDYNKFNQIDEYADWLNEYNYEYKNGETGYERYYTDLLGFWRDIYRPGKTITLAQLQELKSDSNIEYSIKLVDGEEDAPDESFMCTTKGIELRGGAKYDAHDFILTSDTVVKDKNYYQLEVENEEETYKRIKNNELVGNPNPHNKRWYERVIGTKRLQRQEELKKEVKLSNTITLFEIQLSGNNLGRALPKTQPEWYKHIKWDTESFTFPNLLFYKQIFNQNTQKYEYLEVGKLNDIIKTNYKILGYMYYLLSPNIYWNDDFGLPSGQEKTYLLREDLDTHIKTAFAKSDLWRMMAYDAEKYSERFNFYNNASWTLVQNKKATLLGSFYDLTTLYYNAADIITSLSNSNIANPFSDNNLTITYDDAGKVISCYYEYDNENIYEINNNELNNTLKNKYLCLDYYPKNKQGISLTNIQNMYDDKMALLLWARANNILLETDNNFSENGFHKNVFEQPDKLKFWFDFLSPNIFNQTYSVKNIGPREIVKKDSGVNCITSQAIPDIIFINPNKNIANTAEQQLKIQQSYFKQVRPNSTFLHLNLDMGKKITTAPTTKTAIDVIMNLLYNHAMAPNSLTISCIPQYYLTTDAILQILGNEKILNKQYLITKISCPLGHNGLMTINTQEFIDDILDEQIEREIIIDTK